MQTQPGRQAGEKQKADLKRVQRSKMQNAKKKATWRIPKKNRVKQKWRTNH